MLALMEKYATTLEKQVAERTVELSMEKKLTENLLLRMLPRYVSGWVSSDPGEVIGIFTVVAMEIGDSNPGGRRDERTP